MNVIVGGELFTDYPITLATCQSQTQTSNQQAPDATSFFPVGCLPQAALAWRKDFSPKVRTLWHCSRLRSVALYLWLIVVISVRQSTAASNIWASLPGAGYGQFEHKAGQPDCKIQRSGRNGQEIDGRAGHRDYSRSGYRAVSIARLSWAVNHYRDNAITYKAQRDKNARVGTEAGERGNYRHADAPAWCCCARCKIHEGVSWCRWKWCSAWDDVIIVVGCTSKQSVSQCVKPPRSGVDNAASRLADTAERDYFTLRERLIWILCKNNWKEPRSILMSSADRVAHIDGQLSVIIVSNKAHALPGV